MKKFTTIIGVLAVAFVIAAPKAEARTVYNSFSYNGALDEEWYLKTSPFKSTTHALHPYWRNTYNLQKRSVIRNRRPEFRNYLEDLYYQGHLGTNLQPYDLPRPSNPTARCYNYSRQRATHLTPSLYTGCQHVKETVPSTYDYVNDVPRYNTQNLRTQYNTRSLYGY